MPRESPVPGAPPRYSQTPPLARWRAEPPISSRTPPARGGRSASVWTRGTTSLLPVPMGRRSPRPVHRLPRSPTWLCGETPSPADSAVELVLEYGGFPRDWNIAHHAGLPRDQRSLSVPGESEPDAPICSMFCPEGQGYPTTVELTVPGSMTVIPFGTARQAEVVETHGRHRNLAL